MKTGNYGKNTKLDKRLKREKKREFREMECEGEVRG